jgi:hypothetical protein
MSICQQNRLSSWTTPDQVEMTMPAGVMSCRGRQTALPECGHVYLRPFRCLEICGVILLYLLLTLIATFPAVKSLNTRFIGGGDTLVNAWNLWWIRWAVTCKGQAPFHTSMLYHPDGVSLAYHTLNLFNGCLAILFQTVLGLNLITTFNVISLLTFVASGLSTFVLVRSMTGSPTAGLVAGLIFTFSPYRVGRVSFGNLDLYSTQFIPLLVWFLTRMNQTHQWRYAMGAAIALSLTGWCSLELGFGTGILTVFLFVLDLYGTKLLMVRLKRWFLFALLTCVFMSPFILPMARDYPSFQDQTDQSEASASNSADLLGFFIPDNATQPLIKRVGPGLIAREIDRIYATFYGNPSEKTVFLGYSVLAMTIISLCVVRSNAVRRWLLIAIMFFVLCLGPVLRVAGRAVLSPMPYALLFRLPLLKFGRSPSRLAIFLMLAVAIITGCGCAALERRWEWFKWVTILIGGLIFAEFLIIPLRLDSRAVSIPAYYDLLAEKNQKLAILDIPIDLYGAQGPAPQYMLYQTVHQKPIVGGYISRTPTRLLQMLERPFLYQLRARVYNDAEPYEFSPGVVAQGLEDLHSLNVQYIILHKSELSAEDCQTVRLALGALLSEPVHEDGAIVVWRLDAAVDNAALIAVR